MAFTLGQHKSDATFTTKAQSISYASNVTQGNLLIVMASISGADQTITTAYANTGTAGVQTWHPLIAAPYQSGTAGGTFMLWWAIASGTGSCTCSLTWSYDSYGEMAVVEFSGTSISSNLVQDGAGQTHDGTAVTITVPPITTTYSDDLVIGFCSLQYIGGSVVSPWNLIEQPNNDDVLFYRADLGPNTYTPNVTQTSGEYACIMAALGTPPATIIGVGWFHML